MFDLKEYKRKYYIQNKKHIDSRNLTNYYDNKKTLEDRKCQNCSQIFKPKRSDNKFCVANCGVEFWRKNNKDKQNEYFKKVYHTDLNRKLSSCLRSRLSKALKGGIKSDSTMNLLGCSIEQLKTHLESQFQPGMTWNNWSKDGWHIDHVVPLNSFDLTNKDQLSKACHYTNLQPLWAKDNLSKGAKV